MILGDLKNLVKSRREISLVEAALHFDMDPDAMRGLLEFWVRKGRISRRSQKSDCAAGCACIYRPEQETYVWNPQIGDISIEARSDQSTRATP